MSEYDYVIVGSGINALVAAAMLGKKRRSTLVLERNDSIGGCLCTEAATLPGFVHDVMATTLVLFRTSPAWRALGKDLEARGFAFADTNLPIRVLRPDGSSVIFSMDRARNVKTFDALAEGDGRAFASEMDALGPRRAVRVRAARRLALVVRDGEDDPQPSFAAGAAWSGRLASATRSRRRAVISRRLIDRKGSARSGRPGCCTPGSGPRAPIPRRWPR